MVQGSNINSNDIFIGMKTLENNKNPCEVLYKYFNINVNYVVKCLDKKLDSK